MNNNEIIISWLKRAKSSLEIAKAGKVSENIFYEDFCFHTQEYEPASEGEYKTALKHAENVYNWVMEKLKELGVDIDF